MQLPATTKSITSREIAELTGKRHDHVLRDIDKLAQTLSPELGNGFQPTTYKDGNGIDRRMFVLDRDSTYCLVAGYDANARMKIIKRWQELEAGQAPSLPAVTDPALAAIVQTVIELDAVKRQQAQQAQQLTALEQRVEMMDGDTGYMTVMAYTRSRGIRLPLSTVRAIGKRASKTAKELDIQLGSTPDERFGSVNSYPTALLDEVFAKHMQAA